MTHLTVDEIIEFVSFNALNKENLALAAKVNGHIRSCKSCFEKVSSFQTVYDKLRAGGNKAENCEIIAEDEIKAILDSEANKEMDK